MSPIKTNNKINEWMIFFLLAVCTTATRVGYKTDIDATIFVFKEAEKYNDRVTYW